MSSLTAVKVRGKRQTNSKHTCDSLSNPSPKGKRPSSSTSASPIPPKRPRQATSASNEKAGNTPVRCASPLENLPTELLETIFFYCLNVRLPQASFLIGRKLASHHIKSQLVYKVLSSSSTTEYPCAVAAAFPTIREQAEAQSAILRLRWMTLPFLRDLIPEFIVKTLVRELAARNIPWKGQVPVLSPAFEPSIRQYVEDNAYHLNDLEPEGLPAYREIDWQADPATLKGLSKHWGKAWIKNDVGLWVFATAISETIYVGIGLQDGLVTLGNPYRAPDHTISVPHSRVSFSRWRILCGVEGCRIPNKLLHGPWIDEKCEFLEIAIRGGASVDWISSTSGEVANDGLLQAIEERNARAVRALLPRLHPPDSFPIYTPGGTTIGVCFDYREVPARRGVGVIATTEHLRKAVVEGSCQEDVIEALLQAPSSTIDTYDAVINQWALDYNSRGKVEGTRLLNQLQKYPSFQPHNPDSSILPKEIHGSSA